MADVVRAALVQPTWTGDTESMIAKHEEHAREAARRGARVIGFQEVSDAPCFCQVQDPAHHRWAEPVPGGPTVERMRRPARETAMVVVAPVHEVEQPGHYYNTAAGRIGVSPCHDRHFPEGRRALGLAVAQIVYNPSATSRSLSAHLRQREQPAAAVANGYFAAAINRVGKDDLGDNDFYGTGYFVDPRGQFAGETAGDEEEEPLVRDLDLTMIDEVRQQWAFHRDRRPDAHGELVRP